MFYERKANDPPKKFKQRTGIEIDGGETSRNKLFYENKNDANNLILLPSSAIF